MATSGTTLAAIPEGRSASGAPPRKRRKAASAAVLGYLDSLPCATQYESSYMHRDVVSHAVVANRTAFLATASEDGHVKFWKKMQEGIEFVKHYHAHVGPCRAARSAGSRDGSKFAVTCADATVRLFDTRTGKLLRTLDERVDSLDAKRSQWRDRIKEHEEQAAKAAEASSSDSSSDDEGPMPEGYSKAGRGTFLGRWNCAFDETGEFLLYGAMLGVNVVHAGSGRVAAVVGAKDESERFGALAVFAGAAKLDAQAEQARRNQKAIETGDETKKNVMSMGCEQTEEGTPDPSRRARPRVASAPLALGTDALRTTAGDIKIKLHPNECPKTVENFCTHARDGYYDGLLFHRCIKQFMVQTGDPLGDGTGGESIWGGEFQDEFHPSLKHDRPFTVSMATRARTRTAPNHRAPCNRFDKPHDDIKIITVDSTAGA
ncbi:peptidyl-prolyl cis-trans isomerase [Aureococcus anophagefferens]|nr:peptidyl-prolyl cis-trans isomerase [Aureococcus anophagefferens]